MARQSDRLLTELGRMGESVATPWGDLRVVTVRPDQAQAVLRLRDDLASWMVERGIDQWRPGEMPLDWIEECTRNGWAYGVWREGRLVASVTLVWADPFVWGEQDEPAGYVHMLMVDRAYAGLGLGRALLRWAEDRIRASGRGLARLDCVSTNVALCAYYESAGYHLVGHRNFAGHPAAALGGLVPAKSVLYEKNLDG